MQSHGIAYLEEKFGNFVHKPVYGHIELTYRCNYACLHCCCQGSENIAKELTTKEILKILDDIHQAGCLWLAISGGDPLLRDDFKIIYYYAKKKGFLITLLTNGYLLNKKLIDYLAKYPPISIDITVNSMDEKIYRHVTGAPRRALKKVKDNIEYAAKKGLSIIIKANAMKPNKNCIPQIKKWAAALPSKSPEKLFNFRYDPIIYPRFNGDTSPCRLRLNQKELATLAKLDPDIACEERERKHKTISKTCRNNKIYYCNTYRDHFFIDPFGSLKFCSNTYDYSIDLKKISFKEGFYKKIPLLAKACFTTDSPCKDCHIRNICYSCPAAALLEKDNKESPVKYFCRLAHHTAKIPYKK